MGAQTCLGVAVLSAVLGLRVCSVLQTSTSDRKTAQWAVSSNTGSSLTINNQESTRLFTDLRQQGTAGQ